MMRPFLRRDDESSTNGKAPPPMARGAKIRLIANSDRDQKKMREFPLFDVFCIVDWHLPSKWRISCATGLFDVKTPRPGMDDRNQRAEVESCFPLSKLQFRRAANFPRIFALRDGIRCWLPIRNTGTKAFQVLSPILSKSIGLLLAERVRSPSVLSLTWKRLRTSFNQGCNDWSLTLFFIPSIADFAPGFFGRSLFRRG